MESGNVPYASRATSYPSQQHSTFEGGDFFFRDFFLKFFF